MNRMSKVFEIIDKSRRKIYLSKERWNDHIKYEHQDMQGFEEIIEVLENPDKIVSWNGKHDYFKYFKHRKSKSKYLKVVVNYLNGEGFVITAYYKRDMN